MRNIIELEQISEELKKHELLQPHSLPREN